MVFLLLSPCPNIIAVDRCYGVLERFTRRVEDHKPDVVYIALIGVEAGPNLLDAPPWIAARCNGLDDLLLDVLAALTLTRVGILSHHRSSSGVALLPEAWRPGF